MKTFPAVLLGVLAATVVLAQVPNEPAQNGPAQQEEYQAPVEEGLERPDSPASEQTAGNAEAQMPNVEQDDSADEVDQPPAQDEPEVEQPGVEP